jgi:hypothetical protein
MKRAPLVVIIVLAVLVVALGSWLLVRLLTPPSVNSYAECVAAGYPILETYPEQCRTPDGRTFTNPDAPPQTPPPTSTPTPTGDFVSEGGTTIGLNEWADSPISSPLTVSGEVPGSWSFEASFPVRLTDEDGVVIAEAVAQLEGDWMTDEMVPFQVTLTFDGPPGGHGFLVLVKENPSGLPEHDDSVSIPITYS